MNIVIRTKKLQGSGFLGFLAWPSANHDSKYWLAKQHHHIQLGSSAMLWNMHWKEQSWGRMHLGLLRMLLRLSQERPQRRSSHVKGVIM
jgi:hypothetical protein